MKDKLLVRRSDRHQLPGHARGEITVGKTPIFMRLKTSDIYHFGEWLNAFVVIGTT